MASDEDAPTTRLALATDVAFLEDMLVEAINWNPERPRSTPAAVLGVRELHHYVEGWPRPDDLGLVAEDSGGKRVGATWWRYFARDDPGFGFIAEGIPEISIGVIAERRGEGIGTLLLARLEREARRRGIIALGLSVEARNPAVRLYLRRGYQRVGGTGGAHTMRLDL